ncbi:aldehyde-activating protein [Vibrio parahaemolyticus]|uniref:GFA family protein n=1 Tax=Vibrio parahaemolyticus TaxID=670 RepID=UPI001123F499|nr:aldehyde-activating protein [Vibrio parahaemolyticus]TOB22506.1 aldehyde-activating protein [Vibrio parahaemolyticus]TOL08726.1 aldehyde-activating protein [Vibrio parahaemolyticus]TOO91868.1 aldehyde-activating protein [Vibrio parahaemolyticus]TOO97774.1 aldehyde-activating protein [Vibrio parahaemolyticus]
MEVSCHCGNVEITLGFSPNELGKCNCSICRRYSALWAYYSPKDVQIKFQTEKTVFYIWGDREVEFHRCNICGCITHYVTTEKCSEDIVAVNMRMAEVEALSKIPVNEIDGASR